MPTRAALCALALLSASGAAQAAFFSFASDSADHAWTFTGSGNTWTSQSLGQNDPIVLNIDDNNGVLPRLEFSTRFGASFSMSYAGSVPLGGGVVSHNYLVNGTYSFTDIATNTMILSASFSNQLFTARGTASSWFTTAALQGDNSAGSVALTWSGANLPGYGLGTNTVYPGGFAFALDSLNTSGAIPYAGQSPGVGLNGNNFPLATWFAESSFVATTVPGPGTFALLGLAGLVACRRRRGLIFG